MGAWDIGPFDNDAAADWCGELDDASAAERESIVRRALTTAVDEPEYLDIDSGSEAVAAAAVVAAHQSNSVRAETSYGPNYLTAGGLEPFPDDVVSLANRALDRVAGENSELREEYAEGEDLSAWLATIAAVRAELNGDA